MIRYIRAWILYPALCLSLAACAGNSKPTQAIPAPSDLDIPLCDCRPYPKPGRLNIKPISPENVGADGWILDNQSYLNNADVWQQFRRYMNDTDAALDYWHQCVAACNQRYIELNNQ